MNQLLFIVSLFLLSSCMNLRPKNVSQQCAVKDLPASLSHSEIRQVFPNVYFVTGQNVFKTPDVQISSSRNMVIFKQDKTLTLINSIRLDDNSLRELESLGTITHVVRLGPFHGRDDAFYQKKYNARLWALKSMSFEHGETIDFDLAAHKKINQLTDVVVIDGDNPEAVLLFRDHGGILVSCDSIKNWTRKDQYFDQPTFILMQNAGAIGPANIDSVWLDAARPKRADLLKIKSLNFKHLISAHGDILKDSAHSKVTQSLENLPQKEN